jgi:hypothetical protein
MGSSTKEETMESTIALGLIGYSASSIIRYLISIYVAFKTTNHSNMDHGEWPLLFFGWTCLWVVLQCWGGFYGWLFMVCIGGSVDGYVSSIAIDYIYHKINEY